MGGLIGWILRLLGMGSAPRPNAARRGRSSGGVPATAPRVPPPETLSPEQLRAARRRVIAYVGRSRVPLRQVVAIRQQWLVQLGKVYESIASSPTDKVLELAGQVGENYEPGFRDALMLAQSIEPPPECEAVHAAMVGWITALHSACLALMDARKLKDRSMLANLREQLGAARKYSAALVGGRAELFDAYRLNIRPTVQKRKLRPAPADAEPPTDGVAEEAPTERPRSAPTRTRARLVATTTATRTTEKRSAKPARVPSVRRTNARGGRRQPR